MGASQQGTDALEGRWVVIPRTLCFVINDDAVLLMKRGPHRRVFPNQYNGLGGHIERDEDPLTSARREISEECGLDVPALRLVAVHTIDTGAANGILLFVFVGHSHNRNVISDDREGTLEWVALERLNTLNLVEDLPLILPRYLTATILSFAHVTYDASDTLHLHYAE